MKKIKVLTLGALACLSLTLGACNFRSPTSSGSSTTSGSTSSSSSSSGSSTSDISVTSISLSATSKSVKVGSTFTVTANVLPRGATNKAVTWTSSNESIITAVGSGTNNLTCTVTGKSVGNATVTATTVDGGFTASCSVSVVEDTGKAAWTILMYVCGADLESSYASSNQGLATSDLKEIASVSGQTEDYNIVVEAGGASKWSSTYSSVINKDKLNRFHLSNKSYVSDAQITKANMGLTSTLQSFLEWGIDAYPADKYGIILWNHGGAMQGVCYDENYDDDSLSTSEVAAAVKGARTNLGITDKFEFIGYDACLMGVQDIASINADYFNYMIGSQESESGYGWDYDTWVDDLFAGKPTTTVLKAIVDGFIAENGGTSDSSNDQTLAYYDLSYSDAYVSAWEQMSSVLSSNFVTSSSGWTTLKNLFNTCKRYGYDEDYGYTFGVGDAHDFIDKMQASSTYKSNTSLMSACTAVETAFNNFVAYESHGKGAGNSYGLSMFMPVGFTYNGGSYANCSSAEYSTSCTKLTTWRTFCVKYGAMGA